MPNVEGRYLRAPLEEIEKESAKAPPQEIAGEVATRVSICVKRVR